MALYDECITRISCGLYHIIALTEENELYAWGESEHGNCGTGEFEDIILIPQKMVFNI